LHSFRAHLLGLLDREVVLAKELARDDEQRDAPAPSSSSSSTSSVVVVLVVVVVVVVRERARSHMRFDPSSPESRQTRFRAVRETPVSIDRSIRGQDRRHLVEGPPRHDTAVITPAAPAARRSKRLPATTTASQATWTTTAASRRRRDDKTPTTKVYHAHARPKTKMIRLRKRNSEIRYKRT
jgi:hypothetical protein